MSLGFSISEVVLNGAGDAGVFGVLLSELVEREGVDSTLGVGFMPVRIPSFVDDVITAMKQMGESSLFRHSSLSVY